MRYVNILRTAALAASLLAPLGNVGTAFADTTQTQQFQRPSNGSPYDSPNFVIDEANIHS
jgi:hypothetical protein